MKHGAWRVVAILLLVLAGLWLLQYLPPFTFLGHQLEPVRLLSLFAPKPMVQNDSAVSIAHAPTPCPEGVVCIDDYGRSDSTATSHGMAHFYKALHALKRDPKRKVRIAFYGDSFIEADILTGELRQALQREFGGSGVGWLAMRSDRNDRYRPSVAVTSKGWHEHEMRYPHTDARRLGIAGLYLTAQAGAYTEVQLASNAPALPEPDEHSVYYAQPAAGQTPQWQLALGHGQAHALTAQHHGSVGYAKAGGKANHARWLLSAAPTHATYWGLSMESASGIVLDNFSMRSETGANLLHLPEAHLRDFHAVRPYDLIVLQYGLNVMSAKAKDYTAYVATMHEVLAKLQRAFPSTSILVFGISDRAQRQHGAYATMPAVKPFVATQRQLAHDAGVAFWDTYAAMQYEGGIVGMVAATPRQAALDYTHVNHAGGARIAHHFYQALRAGLQRYEAAHTHQ